MGFTVFARMCAHVKRSAVHVGERVRLVEDRGCMAHIRGPVREGVVQAIKIKSEHNGFYKYPTAVILLDDCAYTIERCAEPRLWQRHTDGIMEYHS